MPGLGLSLGLHNYKVRSWAQREPTNVAAIITGATTAIVTWTDSAVSGADGYKVYAGVTLKGTIAVGVQTVSITGLTADTEYVFKVVAYKGSNESTGDNDTATTYLTTTMDYKTRVEADGGVIYDLSQVNFDYKKIVDIGEADSLILALSSVGGVKKQDVGGRLAVSKWYDFSGNNLDPAQADETKMPGFYGDFSFLLPNQINFKTDDVTNRKILSHAEINNANFTAFYVIRETNAAGFLHSGSLNAQGTVFLTGWNGISSGPAMYKQAPSTVVRASNEYPTSVNCRLLTFSPDHIYLNGTEVTYIVGKTDTMIENKVTTIGGRPDNIANYNTDAGIVAILKFNKVLDEADRQAVESYLIANYLNADYTISDIAEVSEYEQLTYRVLYNKGNIILAAGGGKAMYSTNNGESFAEISFTGSDTIRMGYVFNNGTIFLCTSKKVYKSVNGLSSVTEVTPKDEAGNTYTPADNFVFSPFHKIDSQEIDEDNEIIAWGNYGSGAVAIWASLNGADCKMVYRFGASYDYNANHIHSVCYSSSAGKWYVQTGDTLGMHFLEAVYNGSWAFTYLLAGVASDQTKGTFLSAVGNELYWSADVTLRNSNNGIWKCATADFGTAANHVRELGIDAELCNFLVETNRIIFVIYHTNLGGIDRKWEVFVYNRTTKEITRKYINGITPTKPASGYFLALLRDSNDGQYYMDFFFGAYVYNTVKFSI